MLLFQYPPKIDKRTAQLVEFNASKERKKIRKNAVKSVAVGLVILALSFFVSNIAVKFFVFLVAGFNMFTAYLLYKSADQINDKNNWTRIYDDHIEHSQTGVVTGKITEITFYYDDVEKTSQNALGEMVFTFKNTERIKVLVKTKKENREVAVKNNGFSLYFVNSKPKLFLIENLYDKINYPKKNYIVIQDDEDESF